MCVIGHFHKFLWIPALCALVSPAFAGNVYWTGDGQDYKWLTPANWSTGVLPQSTDDVVIGALGDERYTVRLTNATTSQSINSLVSYENLSIGAMVQMSLYVNQLSSCLADLSIGRCALHIGGNMTWSGDSNCNTGTFVTGAGHLILPRAATMNISSGNVDIGCFLDNSGAITIQPGATLELGGSIINTGQIDLSAGRLRFDQPDMPSLLQQIRSGLHPTGENGGEIFSSRAGSQPATAIGYQFDGSACVLGFTWLGDADLNGIVDAADFQAIAPIGADADWATGDFNYDGLVNGDDYALFQIGYSVGSTRNISTVVPEPAAIGIAALAGLRRRRV